MPHPFQPYIFWIIALLTGMSAIAVVVTQNIVRSATYLLFALAGTAGIFFLLGADFVAATQLFVYVGGTLVLVVFGVMLTAQGPFITMKTNAAEWAIAAIVGALLFGVLSVTILTMPETNPGTGLPADPASAMSSAVLGESLLGIEGATPSKNLPRIAHPRKQVGYLLPFEIVSVHLLVVLIGAAYLARAKRRKGAPS